MILLNNYCHADESYSFSISLQGLAYTENMQNVPEFKNNLNNGETNQ